GAKCTSHPRGAQPGAQELKTVKEEYEKLSKDIFPTLKIAMLHGKMGAPEKERIMRSLKRGKTNILVSTSVVEVGVDIQNASVIMIEDADRFGLAQLHQFRGRVGRSRYQSYCFLFTQSGAIKTKQRLRALLESDNGFELAEKDLQLRGPGDFSGNKQWGLPDFAMENLANLPLVQETRTAAIQLLEKDLTLKGYPQLKKRVEELREKLHLE
ncbi:MAG: helicase-related protein, partial [bacterium]|nr:helicase-related protein [bacterium]